MDHQSIVNTKTPDDSKSIRPVSFVSSKKQPPDHAPGTSPTPHVEEAVSVECDQAIFTSQKSPMGEGYRIVASSPGIRPEEKAEITRRSPSHGSLANNSPQSEGMLAYPLPTGRYCVCHCKHDGAEHTARGGLRVRTHAAILDPKCFEKLDDNPFVVHQALAQVPVEVTRAFNPTMGRLQLKSVGRYSPPRYLTNPNEAEAFLRVTRALLSDEACVLAGVPEARPTLEWAFMMLPMSVRAMRSVSVGINFSMARQISATVIHHDFDRVHQMITGQSIRWRDLRVPPAVHDALFDDWIDFVNRRADQGRLQEIGKLTNRMNETTTQVGLARVAKLCQDRDAADTAERDVLVTLQSEYAKFTSRTELETELVDRLLHCVESRIEQLDEEAREAEEAQGEDLPAAL